MHLNPAIAVEPSAATLPPLGPALQTFAREQLQQAQAHLAREGEARHAGIHQARKCLRRARATLALGRRVLGDRARRLDEELGRLCRGLSRLRDGQALLEVLARLDATAPPELRASLPDVETAARRRRDRLLEEALVRDPEFLARRRRLQALGQRLDRLDWRALDETAVAAAVARSLRRADKAERRARRHPERDTDWHVYRRRLRRLRQQDSLLAEVRPELRPAAIELEEKATVLGEAQDDALLLNQCGRGSPFAPAARVQLRRVARERLQHVRCG